MKRGVLFLILAMVPSLADSPAWVEKSNRNAQVLLELQARFFPEGAGRSGVSGVDEQIIDMKPDAAERKRQAGKAAESALLARLGLEKDPLVRQDLEILIGAVGDSNRGIELNRKYYFPYSNVAQIVYGGLNALLDDQVAANRRPVGAPEGDVLRLVLGRAPAFALDCLDPRRWRDSSQACFMASRR